MAALNGVQQVDSIAKDWQTPESSQPEIGFLSSITAAFMNRIINNASNNQLKTIDQSIRDPGMTADEAYQIFRAAWIAECERVRSLTPSKKEGRDSSLSRALWTAYRQEILKAAALKLLWGVLVLLSVSYFVRELLKYIRVKYSDPDHTAEEATVGILFCAFFFLSTVLLSVALQQMNAVSARLGLRVKAAVSMAVYRKSLTVDRHVATGKVDLVSLVATDCNKLGEACTHLQFLWSGIVEALAILGVLVGFVGTAALPGLGVLLLLVPVQYAVGMAAANSRKKTSAASDARVRLMDEILRAIKLVKMYAWEGKFADGVANLRHQETARSKVGAMLKTINLALVFVLPPLIALGIFGVHALETRLDSALAFTTLSLFNTLRLPLVQLPKGLRALVEATSAVSRIQAFLLAPERSDAHTPTHGGETAVRYSNASFAYDRAAQPLLHDITLSLPRGSLTMVAGPVASGKSNLLLSVLSQMSCVKGSAEVGGSTFAYVPQTPWCAHGTVRDNILFGRPWNETRYRRILFACALERDMQLMDDGDLTEIGERGMNLSGGQKQRIALARAAYSGAQTLLLDAPLSAVDMYTSQHIFRHCIAGLLATEGSTVLLVTHQTELFPRADVLVVMAKGRAAYAGPFNAEVVRTHFPNSTFNAQTDADDSDGNTFTTAHTDAANEEGGFDAATVARTITPTTPVMRTASSASVTRTITPLKRSISMSERRLQPTAKVHLLLPGTLAMEAHIARKLQDARGAKSKLGTEAGNGYLAMFHALRWYLVFPSLFIFIITQITRIYSDIWISLWVGRKYSDKEETWYIGMYGGYVALFLFLLLTRGAAYYAMGLAAASRLHEAMISAVLAAPMSFFTLTPLGRVLSVFSKDMDTIDESLLDNAHLVTIYACILGTTIGVVIRVVPIFAAIAASLLLASFFVFRAYLAASGVLKERAGTSSAAVIAHVSETLQGVSVIQAYKAEARFIEAHTGKQADAQTAGFTLEMLQLWLAFRQDLVGCCLVLATCALCIAQDTNLDPAAAGLAVSNSFQILLFLSLMVRGAADVHAGMGSVERVVALGQLQPEPDAPDTPSSRPRPGWPSRGEVDLHDVVMSYLPSAPHVLKGCTFNVRAGEHIGVVGRTGAGKSSLIMSMFRLAPLSSGAVRIDGIDVTALRLSELRRKIAIIPQEPVMFEGTLRANLDPFQDHTDEVVASALERCLLGSILTGHPEGLSQQVSYMGSNFSLGQQQLLCLARALLNGSKLLLLDEATAALDTDTDAAVQKVLRTAFSDRTVMTIAHRLDTIIDSDRILVMDAGRVAEFDSPASLLRNKDSIFSQLCMQTGAGSSAALRAAAEKHESSVRALEVAEALRSEVRTDHSLSVVTEESTGPDGIDEPQALDVDAAHLEVHV